jgi:hypothetical protein
MSRLTGRVRRLLLIAFLAAVLAEPATAGLAFDLVSGSTPIGAALGELARAA